MSSFDPNRYVSQGPEQAGQRSPRDRMGDLINAHIRAQGGIAAEDRRRNAQLEEKQRAAEKEAARQRRDRDTRWGTDVAQGIGLGGSVGGPWGAAIGGIAGGVKGISEAVRRRQREGKGFVDALGTTLLDFQATIPGFETAAPAVQAVARGTQAQSARNEKTGFDPAATMEAMRARSGSSPSSISTAAPGAEFAFQEEAPRRADSFGEIPVPELVPIPTNGEVTQAEGAAPRPPWGRDAFGEIPMPELVPIPGARDADASNPYASHGQPSIYEADDFFGGNVPDLLEQATGGPGEDDEELIAFLDSMGGYR